MIVKANGYNRTGEGIIKIGHKVFYIPGLLDGETAKIKITEEHEKWGKGKLLSIITASSERNPHLPDNHLLIGGYELIHMNQNEQIKFKKNKIINDFKNNANYNLKLEPMFCGEKRFRYRNKITLHDGHFYRKNSHEHILLKDFLLTNIKPYTRKKGEIIIRKLDTIISGTRKDKKFTTDTMLNIKFKISIGAFYQVNKEVALVIYQEILNFIDNNQIVFDLFSGIGTIALLIAKKAKHVFGVERNNASYHDAVFNLKQNKIKNVTFIKGDVNNVLPKMKRQVDVVIVDPARKGLKREICELLLMILPKRIIYLSCNPATQASDYKRLKKHYEIKYAKPFDMFPQTTHIENLLILDRKDSVN